MGYACNKGKDDEKGKPVNQDDFFIRRGGDDHFGLYGVFDGHGEGGHHVSSYVQKTLPRVFLKLVESSARKDSGESEKERTRRIATALKESFPLTHALYSGPRGPGGTTATVVMTSSDGTKLYVAHVGDSRAVFGSREEGEESLEVTTLAPDHKLEKKDGEPESERSQLQAEKQRIESSGGEARDGRVWRAGMRLVSSSGKEWPEPYDYPGLQMSRSIVDTDAHQFGVTAWPTVSVFSIDEKDQVLLICSDGVWEFIENEETLELVKGYVPSKAQEAAEALAAEAKRRWREESYDRDVDDVTVILVWLRHS